MLLFDLNDVMVFVRCFEVYGIIVAYNIVFYEGFLMICSFDDDNEDDCFEDYVSRMSMTCSNSG